MSLQRTERRGVYVADDGRYYLRVSARGPDGVRRYVGPRLATEQFSKDAALMAELEAKAMREALEEGRTSLRTCERQWTVAEWVEELNGRVERRENTEINRGTHQSKWLPRIGSRSVSSITEKDLEDVWRSLRELGHASSTLTVARIYLREPFSAAFNEGLLKRNIVAIARLDVPRASRSRHVRSTFDGERVSDAITFLASFDATSIPYTGTASFVAIQWSCGMRPGEVAQLRREDLTLEEGNGSIWVPVGLDKAERARLIPLCDGQVAAIRAHLERGPRAPRKPRRDRRANGRRTGDVWPASFDFYSDRHADAVRASGVQYGAKYHNTIKHLRHGARRTLEAGQFRREAINTLIGHSEQDRRVERAYSAGVVEELREMTTYMWAQIAPHWDAAVLSVREGR